MGKRKGKKGRRTSATEEKKDIQSCPVPLKPAVNFSETSDKKLEIEDMSNRKTDVQSNLGSSKAEVCPETFFRKTQDVLCDEMHEKSEQDGKMREVASQVTTSYDTLLSQKTNIKMCENSSTGISDGTNHSNLFSQTITSKLLPGDCKTKVELPGEQYESILRPDRGKSGIQINLISNFFQLTCRSGNIYHYDVDIAPSRSNIGLEKRDVRPKLLVKGYVTSHSSMSGNKSEFRLGKQRLRELLNQMIDENKYLKSFKPVYDGRKNLYTSKPLPIQDSQEFLVTTNSENSKTKSYKIVLKPVVKERSLDNKISLKPLHDYFTGETKDIPDEIRMVFDAILRHRDPPFHQLAMGRSFFNLKKDHYFLGSGCEVWLGHNQGVHFTETGPALVVNVASSAFHKSGPVIAYAAEVLNVHITPSTVLQSWQLSKLEECFSQLLVKMIHNHFRNKIEGMANSARDQEFHMNKDGKISTITVEDYYFQQYGIELHYPLLPCLRLHSNKNKIFVPFELCFIPPGQRVLGKLPGNLTSSIIKHSSLNPVQKFKRIEKDVSDIKSETLPYLEEFGLQLNVRPTSVTGRILSKPDIQYKTADLVGTSVQPNDKGSWNMQNYRFSIPATIKNWVLISFVQPKFCSREDLEKFAKYIYECGKHYGLNMDKPYAIEISHNKSITAVLSEIANKGIIISCAILIFSESDHKHTFPEIKYFSDIKFHLTTVCVTDKVVRKKCTNNVIATNLLLKINHKLGGVNHVLSKKHDTFFASAILFGADVVHSPPSCAENKKLPSIAAVVGSLDCYFSKYSACCCELVNPKGDRQTQEIILELKGMVKKGLKAYYKNTKQKPQKILFYRDGVSDGQRQQILEQEIPMVKAACKELDKSYNPTLTFIVVQKRHQVRFKLQNGEQNIPPGTVVDSVVTHRYNYDYYLNSHSSPQGTSRPSHYDVLYDENGFSSDDIEKLSFELCHLYVRCNKSISIPAPIKYADLLAYRAKVLIDWAVKNVKDSQRDIAKQIFDSIENMNNMFYI